MILYQIVSAPYFREQRKTNTFLEVSTIINLTTLYFAFAINHASLIQPYILSGADGRPVVLINKLRYHIRQDIHKGFRDHAFNRFVSDLIPLNRTLRDVREPW